MSKKIISVLLSVTLVLSLFTVFISADELSPVMKKSLSQLQGELSGFYKTAKSQVARDDWENIPGASQLPETKVLDDQAQQARTLAKNGNIVECENFLIDLYGGWDAEKNDYKDGNKPYTPMQNAGLLRGRPFDDYIARDPEYGYVKISAVLGEVTAKAYEIDPETGEYKELKDENGNPILVRQQGSEPFGVSTNPGQYTIDSWYNFAVQIKKMQEFMSVTPQYPTSQLSVSTRSEVQKALDGYRAAYDALELIPSETDPGLTEEQKAEKREINRLKSILKLIVDCYDGYSVGDTTQVDNVLAFAALWDDFYQKQDGSTTQEKVDALNDWFIINGISYKVYIADPDSTEPEKDNASYVALDDTYLQNLKKWVNTANELINDPNATVEQLEQYVNVNETYYDKDGNWKLVDEAEDPAYVRANFVTSITDYHYIREQVVADYNGHLFVSTNYRNAKMAIIAQAENDYNDKRYEGAEAEYQALIQSCEAGDRLLNGSVKNPTEQMFWDAIAQIQAAYETLYAKRKETPTHVVLYDKITEFVKTVPVDSNGTQSMYTEDSWNALKTAIADYESQVEVYNKLVEEINADTSLSENEKAEAIAAELEKVNIKAFLMNDKYNALVLISSNVSSEDVYNAARAILEKAGELYVLLSDDLDLTPYTQESFDRFAAAYEALKEAMDTLAQEKRDGALALSYGDQEILNLVAALISAQAQLEYNPNTCND